MEQRNVFDSGEEYIAANSDDLLAALSTVTPSPPSREDIMMATQGTRPGEWVRNQQQHQQDHSYQQIQENTNQEHHHNMEEQQRLRQIMIQQQQQQQQRLLQQQQLRQQQLQQQRLQQREMGGVQEQRFRQQQQQLQQQQSLPQQEMEGMVGQQVSISNNYSNGFNSNMAIGHQNGAMLHNGEQNQSHQGQVTSSVGGNNNHVGMQSMLGVSNGNQVQNNDESNFNSATGVAPPPITATTNDPYSNQMNQWLEQQHTSSDNTLSMMNPTIQTEGPDNGSSWPDSLKLDSNDKPASVQQQQQQQQQQHKTLSNETAPQHGTIPMSNNTLIASMNGDGGNGQFTILPNGAGSEQRYELDQEQGSAAVEDNSSNANPNSSGPSPGIPNGNFKPFSLRQNRNNVYQGNVAPGVKDGDNGLMSRGDGIGGNVPSSSMPAVPLPVPVGIHEHDSSAGGHSMHAQSEPLSTGEDARDAAATANPIQDPQPLQPKTADSAIIDLIDDDDDNDGIEGDSNDNSSNKRARLSPNGDRSPSASAVEAHMERNANMPLWMTKRRPGQGTPIPIPGQVSSSTNSLSSAETATMIQKMYKNNMQQPGQQQQQVTQQEFHPPQYILLSPEFIPRWDRFMPKPKRNVFRCFELSLLNVHEFTITGLPLNIDGPVSSVAGLRSDIKRIAKQCGGKAVYDRNAEMRDENGDEIDGNNNTVSPEEGRWRIPLSAYHAFFAFLNNDEMIRVEGIPENQLKIASLGKARLEKGFPSVKKLLSYGIPVGLASTLAPFQRGGVEFVVEKGGRALIADDMGLGKTIQAVASASVYHDEWPILILTPSSARYHWEVEFQNWLGADSKVNKGGEKMLDVVGDDGDIEGDGEGGESTANLIAKPCMTLLQDSEIHVLTTSKEDVLPSPNTRVVICSYGLAPSLVESGKIVPGLFRCAIVDESHMLKNINTKRTKTLVPILHATNRCILLSGTPALARPSELWPQLKILSTEQTGWWDDEEEFVKNYVKRTSAARRAELHTMLTGTVMIRRLKTQILKSLPRKFREKAIVDVSTDDMRREFHECLVLLREGKGVLGKLARQHTSLTPPPPEAKEPPGRDGDPKFEAAKAALMQECQNRMIESQNNIRKTIVTTHHQLSEFQKLEFFQEQDANLQEEVKAYYQERLHELRNETPSRATVLNKMYTLTAKAKIPLIVDMLKRWLNDPTKGKLCIFAHHLFVLDAIVDQVGLSNEASSNQRFIRIDGSTSPKDRQAQIKQFQSDPSVRIAVLGITAAGVAVTLTASSTVWFAELFWTPALMIQAEDRCHRIGQNSRVECLYFVASGTLDEILWKLLEKKFKDLGEFVEGREKLKLVIEKTYEGVKELHTIFSTSEEEEDEEDGAAIKGDGDDEILGLEMDLQQDIAELGKEELTMMLPADADEDEVEADFVNDSKQPAQVETLESKDAGDGLGKSEDDAICLSDDDDHDDEEPSKPAVESNVAAVADGDNSDNAGGILSSRFNFNAPFPKCRLYSMVFDGPSFGIQLRLHQRRAIVCRAQFPQSPHGKPAVGDILVGANGQIFDFTDHLPQILHYLRVTITRHPPVRLTFAEDEAFTKYYTQVALPAELELEMQQAIHQRQLKQMAKAMRRAQQEKERPKQDAGEVIELLDDSDDDA